MSLFGRVMARHVWMTGHIGARTLMRSGMSLRLIIRTCRPTVFTLTLHSMFICFVLVDSLWCSYVFLGYRTTKQQTITRDERIYIYLLIIINSLWFFLCYSNNFSSLLMVSSFLDWRHWDISLMFWACSAFFHVHWTHYHERRPLQLSWMGGEGNRDTEQQLNTF